ncbi:beta-propeller fold lactonase family protein [Acaryochloris sp. CCMEE 5410]|uniref:beta-propeller fold lactonase family protein n=1 Tax=Acaryochloris sp. CCMEE 5410 TaxID=310037 RepID=UPI0002DFD438|nr:beta-propeller fold lactonase family protein [Acaryochloris sp. CCMEE 5410]KAI9130941.1 beta-propeller fold lactonase family protein [Acaryochloris sp. CCMEE 5410]
MISLLKSKGLKRGLLAGLGMLLALLIYGLLQLIEPIGITPISANATVQFTGQALLVASDADMVATAYADAQLDRVAGIEDALTIVGLPLNAKQPAIASVQVSNSVMSWPQIIAVSPDGQRAYVAEVRSRPADGIQSFDDIDQMPPGEKITVVDIADRSQPKVLETVKVGRNPEHLSLSPNGRFLAVNLNEPGKELLIAQIKADGTLGHRTYFPVETEGTREDNQTAIWHPSGQYLAMIQAKNRRLGFYRVQTANEEINLTPVTDSLPLGNHLSHPRFTADGRFVLVTDLKWSLHTIPIFNHLLNPKGELIAVQFEPNLGKAPQVVSRVEVGLSPEGFALNPDNSLIATVNMRRTYLPNFLPAWRGKPYSSLSLVPFDPSTGQLTQGKEYGFEGLLAEQVTFDTSGNALAVVIYNYREPSPQTGAIEFWAVKAGKSPKLERTGYKLEVVRGAHDIFLVP